MTIIEEVNIEEENQQTEQQQTDNQQQQQENQQQQQQADNQQQEQAEDKQQESEEQKQQQVVDDSKKTVEEAKKLVTDKGIDYSALEEEYGKNGKLSDETYEKLEKAGISRQLVNGYIRGIEADNAMYVNSVYAIAGGQEEYAKIQQFVGMQGAETIDTFNAIINDGNIQAVKMMISGIKAQMTLKNGTTNKTVLGSGAMNGASAGYADETAFMKALDDARYGVDKKYTEEVAQRLMKSSFVKYNK